MTLVDVKKQQEFSIWQRAHEINEIGPRIWRLLENNTNDDLLEKFSVFVIEVHSNGSMIGDTVT